MHIVDPDAVAAIQRDILPLLLEANMDSSNALRGNQHRFSEASMGYITWDHLRHGLYETRRNLKDWRITSFENDLVAIYTAGTRDIRVRVCRVHPLTRIPTSGKRAKQRACQWPLLSDDLLPHLCRSHDLLIGYDTGILSGIGKVTLQLLYGAKNSISTVVLYTLYDPSTHDTTPHSVQRETLPKGKPVRRTKNSVKKNAA